MKITTYTAVFDGYDTLKPAQYKSLCFTDGWIESVPGWEYKTVFSGRDAKWASRHCKILSHKHIDTEYSIYHDGNIQMLSNPSSMVRQYLDGADIAVFKHPEGRDCVYQEAKEVLKQHKADAGRVAQQLTRYKKEGFPEHYGLAACYVLIRRNTEAVRQFNELWWKEYERGAKRDQLSFPYVCWKLGMKYNEIPGNLFQHTSKEFRRETHKRMIKGLTVDWQTAYGKMLLPEERKYLVQAARGISTRFESPTIVNIGVFRCASMYCLRKGAPDAELIGLDVKACDVPIGDNLRAQLIIGDSTEYHNQFDKSIHLLFVDGDHHYASVRDDLAGWTPKIVPGGIVVMHDYGAQPKHLVLLPHLEGVRRAIGEWADEVGWERLPVVGSLTAYRRPE